MSQRFDDKRTRIVSAATEVINVRGVRGMTLAEVGQMVGLGTSSVTYYFRKREQLAFAVFEETLSRLEALVADAAVQPDPRARVQTYIGSYVELHRLINTGEKGEIAVLSDMRALDEALRAPLLQRYGDIFRGVRSFFGPAESKQHRALNTARASVLTESMYWLPVWLFDYAYSDFDRVRDRLVEMFERGLALDDTPWHPRIVEINRVADAPPGQVGFLQGATRLVSNRGYRGASIDRIAAEINVTKGSFYHHFDSKEDLVLECFRHSYATIATALKAENSGGRWQHLSSVMATLLHLQLKGEWPLMRTTALLTLPQDMRQEVFGRSNRMALRIAGIISDGIAEGSMRRVDPAIVGHAVLPALNAAYELRNWGTAQTSLDRAVAMYASTLAYGLFDDRMA